MNSLSLVFAFLFGLAFGSFLNVCIYRIPLGLREEEPGESVLRSMLKGVAAWRSVNEPARSFCPGCRHEIAWYDNLPVLSWILLGGRCRYCKTNIHIRYLGVELLTGLLFLASCAVYGPTLQALKICAFSFLLLGMIFIDAEHRLLPDAFTIPGLFAGLAFSWIVPMNGIAGLFLLQLRPDISWRIASLAESAAGALIAGGFIYAVGAAYRLVRGHEGMGMGDVKMMACVGAFLGVGFGLLTIFLGSVAGTLTGALLFARVFRKRWQRYSRQRKDGAGRRALNSAQSVRYFAMPFGTFLGTGALVAAFAGDHLLRLYWRIWPLR